MIGNILKSIVGVGRFQLNQADMVSIAKGALVAGLGACLIYAIEAIVRLDFGIWQGAMVAISGVLVNIIRKWLADNTKK